MLRIRHIINDNDADLAYWDDDHNTERDFRDFNFLNNFAKPTWNAFNHKAYREQIGDVIIVRRISKCEETPSCLWGLCAS